jgi:hypothetical protein
MPVMNSDDLHKGSRSAVDRAHPAGGRRLLARSDGGERVAAFAMAGAVSAGGGCQVDLALLAQMHAELDQPGDIPVAAISALTS